MKKLSLILLLFLSAFTPESKLKVEATANNWIKHYNKLETIKQIADKSNLPHQEVMFILLSIDSLQGLLRPQISKQLSDTTNGRK